MPLSSMTGFARQERTGAYGAVMAGDYNARPRLAEVLVHGEQWGIVRPRETYADLIAKDHIPDWLAG